MGAPAPAPRPRRKLPVPAIAGVAAAAAIVIAGVFAYNLLLAPWTVDAQTFPDNAVRNVISTTADANHDGKLSRDEAKAVTELTVDGAASFKGMGKYLPNLGKLTLTGSSLTELDTSDLGNLTALDARGKGLKTVDLSRNGKLASLALEPDVSVSGLDRTGLKEVWLTSEVTYSYQPWDSEWQDGEFNERNRYVATYNPDGTVTQMQELSNDNYYQKGSDPKWSTAETWDYTWKDGKVQQVKHTDEDDPAYSYSYSYIYDDAGRLVKDDARGGTTFTYDDQGRILQAKVASGHTAYAFSYDDKGRAAKVVETIADNDGITTFTYDLGYDEAGNLISRTTQDKDYKGDPMPSYAYVYDENGRLSKVNTSRSYEETTAITYDDQGRVASITDATDGETRYTFTATYDDSKHTVHAEYNANYSKSYSTVYDWKSTRLFIAKDAETPEPAIGGPSPQLADSFAFTDFDPEAQAYASLPELVRSDISLVS